MVVVVLFWKLQRSLKVKQKKRWRRERERERERERRVDGECLKDTLCDE
jgi:hypothetical protein